MKKHTLWLFELIAWGLIIFITLFAGMYIYNKDIRENHTYYVFFKDVDGLIKGSPVKIQGYQVGYVSNISLVNDEAFITFVITDKKVHIPDNIAASVAFTGMGGSKSLELFVSDEKVNNKKYIRTIEPKRINDFYIYQDQIAQNLVTMTTDFMKMCTDDNIKKLREFIKNPEILREVGQTLKTIEDGEKQFMDIRSKYGQKFRKNSSK